MALPGRDVVLFKPADPDALLDKEAFERDEFLPYWADLWPSALMLARRLIRTALRGAAVLELGCGLGLPSIAAALAGGRVLATDWSPEAVEFARRNAAANGVDLDVLVAAWGHPEELVDRGPWDLVLGADLLYEERNADALLEVLPRLVAAHGSVQLADPGREPAERFLARAADQWLVRTVEDAAPPRVAVHELRPRSATTSAVGALRRPV